MGAQEFEKKLFGKTIKIIFYDIQKELAQLLFEEAYEEALRLEKIFNFFDNESELSQLNKKRKMKLSSELLEVVGKALEYCKKTNGEYDISIGKQILERKTRKETTKINCSYEAITLNKNEVTLKNDDVLIDLGSIAKGYIADKIAEFIKEQGITSFFIDARGDLLAFGEYKEIVEIQHPREKEKTIHSIVLKNSAVATSGDYNQYHKSYNQSHILNQKDLISVTVVADNLTDADVFASAVFLSEKKAREKLIEKHPEMKVFTIDNQLNEKSYNNFSTLKNNEPKK
jgi:FAD:protein FMN transferase